MNRFTSKSIVAVFIITLLFICNPQITSGQKISTVVAVSGKLKESDIDIAKVGYIVAKDPTEYYITRSYQDPYVAGVIADQTDLLYTFDNAEGYTSIAVSGVINIWVSNENGAILIDDPITTSTTPGVGMKADNEGAIVGYALETVPENQINPVLIPVQLDLSYTKLENTKPQGFVERTSYSVSQLFENAIAEASQQRSKGLLFIAVLFIIVLANMFGFMVFGRIAVNGILSIGRNPLAKNAIMQSVVVNVLMTIFFTIGSIAIALLILRW